MSGYVKVFDSMLTSSVWQEAQATKVVWVTLLLLANKEGFAAASVPGLAHIAGVSMAECQHAIAVFSDPDPYSGSKVLEGRRIEAVEGGWHLVNHLKYREKLSTADRLEYKRQHEQARRDRRKETTARTRCVVRPVRGQTVDTRGRS